MFDHDKCLAFDPFAGDFGAHGDRILSDKIVKTRKIAYCHTCDKEIPPGSIARWCRSEKATESYSILSGARVAVRLCVTMT